MTVVAVISGCGGLIESSSETDAGMSVDAKPASDVMFGPDAAPSVDSSVLDASDASDAAPSCTKAKVAITKGTDGSCKLSLDWRGGDSKRKRDLASKEVPVGEGDG